MTHLHTRQKVLKLYSEEYQLIPAHGSEFVDGRLQTRIRTFSIYKFRKLFLFREE